MAEALFLGCLLAAATCLALAAYQGSADIAHGWQDRTWQPHNVAIVQVDRRSAAHAIVPDSADPKTLPLIGSMFVVLRDAKLRRGQAAPPQCSVNFGADPHGPTSDRAENRDDAISERVLARYRRYATELASLH